MKEIIDSYHDALRIREKLAYKQMSGEHFLFRGHASTSFKLKSMVGRKSPLNGNLFDSEQRCLNEFVNLVEVENWQQYKINSYSENMFYMSIGRHLGLDCRLLDWTASFDTALYLAASDKKHTEEDGHLWVMCYPKSIDDAGAKIDPFSVKKLTLVKEYFWSDNDIPIHSQPLGIARRFSQFGFFTITPTKQLTTPLNELDTGDVSFTSYRITFNAKRDILNHLYGYSDLLGLSTSSRLEDDIKAINAKYFKQ